MKILKMRLENFQGVKELEIDPQGESSAIYGDNGTGKSTVYNAFTWLMYGKPSTTEKNYTPKTTGSHNLHHSVEMTVELADGSEMVLKKDYHEVYKTIKGNPQPVLSGHTTDYSMDGVPVSETQFKKNLLEIYHDEELAKMLTSYNYFLENMKVADRRKILLQVCGDADFNEVIESQGDLLRELPEMLRKPGKAENYYTVDEYRAIAAKEKNLTDKELGDIPQRIDEAEKAKPDVTGLDEQTIDNTMAEIKEKRRELESQRAARESGATTTIRQQIAELESQRAAGEAKHARAEAEANKGAYERISNLRYMAKIQISDCILNEKEDIKISFNPQMNTIIGGRGSGKSSIIRTIAGAMNSFSGENLNVISEEQKNFYKENGKSKSSGTRKGIFKRTSQVSVFIERLSDLYKIEVTDIKGMENQTRKLFKYIDGEWNVIEDEHFLDLFKAQIFTQKQIYELAMDSNSLMAIIDADIKELPQCLSEKDAALNNLVSKALEIMLIYQ